MRTSAMLSPSRAGPALSVLRSHPTVTGTGLPIPTLPLLDDLISPSEHRGRDGEAEGLGGLEVDHERKLGWLLDGQVGWLGALEDPVDEDGGSAKGVRHVVAIGDQAAVFGEAPDDRSGW